MSTGIVDGHTHLFNVGFLPVEGVILSQYPHPKTAHRIAWLCRKLVERKYKRSMDPHIAVVNTELRKPMTVRTAGEPDLVARFVRAIPDDLMEDLAELTRELADDAEFPRDETRQESLSRLGGRMAGDVYENERLLIDQLLRGAGVPASARAEERLTIEGWDWKRLIEWLLLLLQHERRLFEAMADAWSPTPRFRLAVHHMMDMDPHYASPGQYPSLYPFASEQLARMQAVAKSAAFQLVGFVAYSPFRCDSLSIIQHARAMGFSGVKFYPPSGYRPIGNAEEDIDPAAGVSAIQVNDRNRALFEYCVHNDVPMFTHCSPEGMERFPAKHSGCFSAPQGWAAVLGTPGLESLRLCLGHAGGEAEWLADPTSSESTNHCGVEFVPTVVDLCICRPNVYCDFGYFDGLFKKPETVPWFVARLEAAVARDEGAFARKMCFGTDWHLVAREHNAPAYVRDFRSLISGSSVLAPHVDDIMTQNALRFLGIAS
jgi:hypothetical protein